MGWGRREEQLSLTLVTLLGSGGGQMGGTAERGGVDTFLSASLDRAVSHRP